MVRLGRVGAGRTSCAVLRIFGLMPGMREPDPAPRVRHAGGDAASLLYAIEQSPQGVARDRRTDHTRLGSGVSLRLMQAPMMRVYDVAT